MEIWETMAGGGVECWVKRPSRPVALHQLVFVCKKRLEAFSSTPAVAHPCIAGWDWEFAGVWGAEGRGGSLTQSCQVKVLLAIYHRCPDAAESQLEDEFGLASPGERRVNDQPL